MPVEYVTPRRYTLEYTLDEVRAALRTYFFQEAQLVPPPPDARVDVYLGRVTLSWDEPREEP